MKSTKIIEEKMIAPIVVSVDLGDPQVIKLYEERIKSAGETKRGYIRSLILKDLGIKFIPGKYIKEDNTEL